MRVKDFTGCMFASLTQHIIAHCHFFQWSITTGQWDTQQFSIFVTGLVLMATETICSFTCVVALNSIFHISGALMAFVLPSKYGRNELMAAAIAFFTIFPFLVQLVACMRGGAKNSHRKAE